MLQPKDIGYLNGLKKQDLSICCLQESHFGPEDTFRLKVRGWRTIYHTTGSQKKAGVAILISDKLDFKLKAVTRDEEGHYIIIKGSIYQEEPTNINVYAPNTGAPKYIKQLLTNVSNLIDKNVVMQGTLTPHLQKWIDHLDTRSIKKQGP